MAKHECRSRLPLPLNRKFFCKLLLVSGGLVCMLCSTIFGDARASQTATSKTSPEGQAANPPALEVGKSITRDFAGNEVHVYLLNTTAGQYAKVGVDQRQINIGLSVFDASGQKVLESHTFGVGDWETVTLLSENDTTYRIELRSEDGEFAKGSYEIKIKELRAAVPEDKSRIAIDRLIAEGVRLRQSSETSDWRKAIEKYQQAIVHCKAIKDSINEANAQYLISAAYAVLGEKKPALDSANESLAIIKASPEPSSSDDRWVRTRVQANALEALGNVYLSFGDKKQALEVFTESVPLREAIHDRPGLLRSVNYMGISHGYMGDGRKALEYFEKAHLIADELGDHQADASILNNMCVVTSNLGEYKKALGICHQALSTTVFTRNKLDETITLDNIATIHASMGEYQEALDIHNRSLAIYREFKVPHGEAITLNNIAWIYGSLGEYQKAIDLYNESVKIFHQQGDEYRESLALSNIGVHYGHLGDYQKELEVELKLLPVRQKLNDLEGQGATLNRIAVCYAQLGDKQKASDNYEKALTLFQGTGRHRTFLTTLDNAGELQRQIGNLPKAMSYFNDGLSMSKDSGDRKNEAQILAHIARLERDRGNLSEARTRIEEALAAVESLRVNVKSYQLRASFLASVKQYYEFDIDVLMRLHKQNPSGGFDAAALHASETGRARSLLELISEANAEIRRDVDATLLERERALHQMISDKAERQVRLVGDKQTEQKAKETAKEIEELTTEYEQVQARIRQKSPRYAALTQPVPLNLKQIQTDLVDEDTLLLEYALGEEKSYLFAVTPAALGAFELPKRADIESAAQHAYELLSARNRVIAGESPMRRDLRIQKADAEYPKAAAALSQTLLGPVASHLKKKRLLIVSEGVLQYLPFAALPEPSTAQGESVPQRSAPRDSSDAVNRLPLVFEHEVVTLPSASVLAVLRQELAGRKSSDKRIAVIADPVFTASDPRVKLAGSSTPPANADSLDARQVKRSAAESDLADLVRLRFSRQEAAQIVRFAPEGQVLEAVDFEANRATATSPELARVSILHLATHGLINNQHPELSGVVLSLVDKEGRPQNGFLRLYDIYNLKLDADLVVLSACQTALGKEIKGEGLIGLTRGFMYAGSPRVVASLWQVNDRATAELMGRFYEAVFREQLRPSAALRSAQISMWKDKRWQTPYYWAAFTLQGEWK